jgi:hypothetical protein
LGEADFPEILLGFWDRMDRISEGLTGFFEGGWGDCGVIGSVARASLVALVKEGALRRVAMAFGSCDAFWNRIDRISRLTGFEGDEGDEGGIVVRPAWSR